ncbi:MAG: hemolysin [Candidatus Hepatoplasma vulgare]|nr:MAG: hemolysin [Candidatus Hepatoplasma sp.]
MVFTIIGAFLIVFLVFLSGLFSFSEIAHASTNKVRLNLILKNGNKKDKKRAKRVLAFLEDYNRVITTIVVMNNVINVLATTFAAFYFEYIFDDAIVASLVSFFLMTFLIVFLGELLPKMFARKYSEKGIMKLSFFITILGKILSPITYLSNLLIKQNEGSSIKNEDELMETVLEAERFGITSKHERKIIKATLRFDETKAIDIMIKKSNMKYVYNDLDSDEYYEYAKKADVTRVPVLDKSGKIKYFWNVKKFLIAYLDNKNIKAQDYFYPFLSFKKDYSIQKILKDLKKNRQKICAIVEKSNVLIGIITVEDIVETLIGNIYDEFDVKEDGVYKMDDSQFIVEKNVTIQYLFKTYFPSYKMPSNISKKTTLEEWFLRIQKRKNKNYEFKIDTQLRYGNFIFWVKKDINNLKNIIFEIDLIN